MKRAAVCWLLCLVVAFVYLGDRWHNGITFRSDLLALLPDADQDVAVNAAKTRLNSLLASRVVVMIGSIDRDTARQAGDALAQTLQQSGMVTEITYRLSPDVLKQQGATLFTHRSGLLSDRDRTALEAGQADQLVARALGMVFSPVPVVDATMMRQDPFLLFPAYLAGLPSPVPLVQLDDGIPTVRAGGKTYVLLTLAIGGDTGSTGIQDRFVHVFDDAERQLRSQTPQIEVLRLGSLFYFAAEGQSAKQQTTAISVVSALGTIILMLSVFRAIRPLLLLLVAVSTGIVAAFAVNLWWFGSLHVLTLAFGASLIGIAIDYCLQYFATELDAAAPTPRERLRRALPGIFFGFLTTMIGYATLVATPFPGLREIAVFSATGLAASFLTLVLWLPLLDRSPAPRNREILLRRGGVIWRWWEEPRYRKARFGLLLFGAVVIVVGAARLRFDDDIRHVQALPADLQQQEQTIRRLTGLPNSGQFLLVRGPNDEAALRAEETLLPLLDLAQADHVVSGYQAIARVIPSAARQAQNRQLIRNSLAGPALEAYAGQVGLPGLAMPADTPPLTLDDIPAGSPFSYIRQLAVPSGTDEVVHLVLLSDVSDFAALRVAVSTIPGVTVTAVDPIGDIAHILAEYRNRALALLLASVVLMLPVLIWRYGVRSCWRVLLPPLGAVIFAPAVLAVAGMPFTFFTAIGLILVLSIGFDYALFCREAASAQKNVAMVGIWLAMVTTLLSFGLLTFSGIFALRSFGLVLLIGTIAAFVLSPLARPHRER